MVAVQNLLHWAALFTHLSFGLSLKAAPANTGMRLPLFDITDVYESEFFDAGVLSATYMP